LSTSPSTTRIGSVAAAALSRVVYEGKLPSISAPENLPSAYPDRYEGASRPLVTRSRFLVPPYFSGR